jgi:hypothetical protein
MKQNEIELKEKLNQFNRENNFLNQKIEEHSTKNKNLLEDVNHSNKKLNESTYELDLIKS